MTVIAVLRQYPTDIATSCPVENRFKKNPATRCELVRGLGKQPMGWSSRVPATACHASAPATVVLGYRGRARWAISARCCLSNTARPACALRPCRFAVRSGVERLAAGLLRTCPCVMVRVDNDLAPHGDDRAAAVIVPPCGCL